jgi:hypothetical protein
VKIYPPKEGFTAEEMRKGFWSLYVDVKCTNPECGKEYSLANVNGLGGPCKVCGWPCI